MTHSTTPRAWRARAVAGGALVALAVAGASSAAAHAGPSRGSASSDYSAALARIDAKSDPGSGQEAPFWCANLHGPRGYCYGFDLSDGLEADVALHPDGSVVMTPDGKPEVTEVGYDHRVPDIANGRWDGSSFTLLPGEWTDLQAQVQKAVGYPELVPPAGAADLSFAQWQAVHDRPGQTSH